MGFPRILNTIITPPSHEEFDRIIYKIITHNISEELPKRLSECVDLFREIVGSNARIKEDKPFGNGLISLSESEIRAVKQILINLNPMGDTYKTIIEVELCPIDPDTLETYLHLSLDDPDRKKMVIAALQKTHLLPLIQYVICDALLTGGIGCAEIRTPDLTPMDDKYNEEKKPKKLSLKNPALLIKELMPLFKATGLSLDDFFSLSHPTIVKCVPSMAMELDIPDILLTVLDEERFTPLSVFNKSFDLFNQSLYASAFESQKNNILERMIHDLDLENQVITQPIHRDSNSPPSPSLHSIAHLNIHNEKCNKKDEAHRIYDTLGDTVLNLILAIDTYTLSYQSMDEKLNYLLECSKQFLTLINEHTQPNARLELSLKYLSILARVFKAHGIDYLRNEILDHHLLSHLQKVADYFIKKTHDNKYTEELKSQLAYLAGIGQCAELVLETMHRESKHQEHSSRP